MRFETPTVILLAALLVAQLDPRLPPADLPLLRAALLVATLLVVALLVWNLGHNRVRARPAAIQGAAWLVAFVALSSVHATRDRDIALTAGAPTAALARSDGVAEVRRAWDGHFRALATVDGVELGLLIDTGASLVLLTQADAEALGLDPGALDYSLPITTANGPADVAPVRLGTVRVGDVALAEVEAAVAQPGMLRTSLLGMSFLRRLAEATFRRDVVVLRN